jgi:hypothetical protein
MARREIEERYDRHGAIRLMAQADGYFMVRRPGAAPFVLNTREWAALYMSPVSSPCGSAECWHACRRIHDCGEPCVPARSFARPLDLRLWADEAARDG